MHSPSLVFSRRLRVTPFEPRVLAEGAKAFTIYNHMPLASVFESSREDYYHLCNNVQLWDVAVERQVEISGKDALALIELITPRDLSLCRIGQCIYAPLVDEHGGIVNDPIVLRLAEDRFWLSIADSDVLLWIKGIAFGRAMEVQVFEPDVSPLAIQGPKAEQVMVKVVGTKVKDIRFFHFIETEIAGTTVLLARSGWSGQGGFEVYLQDSSFGLALWDTIWQAGEEFGIRAGCPNLIERLESGLMSYGSDMTLANNPFECGLDRFFTLGKSAEYMSRQALERISLDGVERKMVQLMIAGDEIPSPRSTYEVSNEQGEVVGMITSLAFSPKYDANLSFATIGVEYSSIGTQLRVNAAGQSRLGVVMKQDWK